MNTMHTLLAQVLATSRVYFDSIEAQHQDQRPEDIEPVGAYIAVPMPLAFPDPVPELRSALSDY